MATTKKTETKAAEVKAPEVKPAAEAKTVETKAEAPKKAAEPKKAAAPKKAAEPKKPAAPKKAPVKKEIKTSVFVQYLDKEVSTDELADKVKAAYAALGNKKTDIKTMEIYVKPEESAAYYVINGVGAEEYRIEI